VTDGMIGHKEKPRGGTYQTLVQDAVTHPDETHPSTNYVNKVVTFYNCKN